MYFLAAASDAWKSPFARANEKPPRTTLVVRGGVRASSRRSVAVVATVRVGNSTDDRANDLLGLERGTYLERSADRLSSRWPTENVSADSDSDSDSESADAQKIGKTQAAVVYNP